MKTKQITPSQYAKWKGWTLQNVTHHIRKNNIIALPNVIRVVKYSRFYLLEVPEIMNVK